MAVFGVAGGGVADTSWGSGAVVSCGSVLRRVSGLLFVVREDDRVLGLLLWAEKNPFRLCCPFDDGGAVSVFCFLTGFSFAAMESLRFGEDGRWLRSSVPVCSSVTVMVEACDLIGPASTAGVASRVLLMLLVALSPAVDSDFFMNMDLMLRRFSNSGMRLPEKAGTLLTFQSCFLMPPTKTPEGLMMSSIGLSSSASWTLSLKSTNTGQ